MTEAHNFGAKTLTTDDLQTQIAHKGGERRRNS